MLEVILDKQIPYILMAVFTFVGIMSKCVVSISLKKLTKAAGNMGKSSHALIRLVRAKYEHACMVSDKVQNVEVFVEKYLYEYKVAGIRFHSWRRLERAAAWLCLAAGVLAAGGEYVVRGMSDPVLRYGAAGAGLGILLFLLRLTMDEKYQLDIIRTYMVDYLDNVCARRYEKNREINVPDRQRQREEIPHPEDGAEIFPAPAPIPVEAPEPRREPDRVNQPEVLQASESLENAEPARSVSKLSSGEKEPAKLRKEQEAVFDKGAEEAEETPEKPLGPISKEVLIREILEEFLA